MKLKQLIGIFGVLALAACDADIEPIDQRLVVPEGQDPAAYATYMDALRSYKQSEHYLVCARFDNNPEKVTSEKESLRSMPDSLDIVMLTGPLSKFDREDLPGVQRKSTKVLVTVDCSDPVSAVAKVDEALASVAADGLDGVVVKCVGPADDAAKSAVASVVQKLASQNGKTLLFTGNVAVLAAADRAAFDFFLLDATQMASVTLLRSDVSYLTGYMGIPSGKILPAMKLSGTIADIDGREMEASIAVPQQAVALALGGIALYDVAADYYNAAGTYPRIRGAIELLNPAHK